MHTILIMAYLFLPVKRANIIGCVKKVEMGTPRAMFAPRPETSSQSYRAHKSRVSHQPDGQARQELDRRCLRPCTNSGSVTRDARHRTRTRGERSVNDPIFSKRTMPCSSCIFCPITIGSEYETHRWAGQRPMFQRHTSPRTYSEQEKNGTKRKALPSPMLVLPSPHSGNVEEMKKSRSG